MRILLPALRSNSEQNRVTKFVALFAFAFAFLVAGAKPALANHISSAQVTSSCTSYTMQVTAIYLAPGKSYTITYSMSYTPASGPATVITGSIPFVAPSSGTYTTMITKPINLITDTYKLNGTATLAGVNTINIEFTPTTLACNCPD